MSTQITDGRVDPARQPAPEDVLSRSGQDHDDVPEGAYLGSADLHHHRSEQHDFRPVATDPAAHQRTADRAEVLSAEIDLGRPEQLSAFSRATFGQVQEPVLLEILHRGSPTVLFELAQGWNDLAISLQERGQDLEIEFRRLEPTWEGEAAEQYGRQLAETIRAVRRVAQMCADVGDVMHSTASALRTAQQMHPAPPGVGEVPGRVHVGPQPSVAPSRVPAAGVEPTLGATAAAHESWASGHPVPRLGAVPGRTTWT
ncbi:MAG: WXG100 family type VII secretion target [Phycicoccus sp.]